MKSDLRSDSVSCWMSQALIRHPELKLMFIRIENSHVLQGRAFIILFPGS